MTPPSEPTLPQQLARLEVQLRQLAQAADPAAQAEARELVQTVLDLHAAGLGRLLEIVAGSGESGRAILDAVGRDHLAGSLLARHGLHPVSLESRVREALEKVRPFLESQAAGVELLALAEDAVRLRVRQAEGKYPASRQTLCAAVEEAIAAAAPELVLVEFVGDEAVVFPMPLPLVSR